MWWNRWLFGSCCNHNNNNNSKRSYLALFILNWSISTTSIWPASIRNVESHHGFTGLEVKYSVIITTFYTSAESDNQSSYTENWTILDIENWPITNWFPFWEMLRRCRVWQSGIKITGAAIHYTGSTRGRRPADAARASDNIASDENILVFTYPLNLGGLDMTAILRSWKRNPLA